MPPPNSTTSSTPVLAEQFDDALEQRHVRPGEDGQPDGVGVLLHDGLDDLLRRLVQTGVDDLHAGVAQRASDHLGAAIMTVQTGFGDDDADATGHGAQRTSLYSRVTAPPGAGAHPGSR